MQICVALFSVTVRDILLKLDTHVQGKTPLYPFEGFQNPIQDGRPAAIFVLKNGRICFLDHFSLRDYSDVVET